MKGPRDRYNPHPLLAEGDPNLFRDRESGLDAVTTRIKWAATLPLLVAILLTACGGGGDSTTAQITLPAGTFASPVQATNPTPAASIWTIGPVIDGKNYSVGMPRRPEAVGEGFAFDFPVKKVTVSKK